MEKKIYTLKSEPLTQETLNEIDFLLNRYPQLYDIRGSLIRAVQILVDCYRSGKKILVCGNGGSAADSLHIVGELMKSFVLKRTLPEELQAKLKDLYSQDADYYISQLQGAVPVISLVNEVGLLTAYSNDNNADLAFAQQVLGYGNAGDILIAISTSGNSKNILHAAKIAKAIGIDVVALTGKGGGELKDFADVLLAVPSETTYQIQELHLPIYHAICLALEKQFFYQ